MDLELIVARAQTPSFARIPMRDPPRFRLLPMSYKNRKPRLRLLAQSPGDTDPNSVQERLNLWLLKTQNFFNEVTAPLVKAGLDGRLDVKNSLGAKETEEVYIAEQTINSKTKNGDLSLAAIVSIEQFSRMNGLTGQRMQKIFEALVPEAVHNDARNLVEYCCFRFLSRESSQVHSCLKEPAFQRLIFITMLAWQQPYSKAMDPCTNGLENSSQVVFPLTLKKSLVREDAFVRIAPAVAGVADRSTVHNLFKALVGNEEGISLSLWTTYIEELLKVHDGRRSYHSQKSSQVSAEQILCIGSSRKRPVLKWENNMAWPGKLTLTDNALYFEPIDLIVKGEPVRLDLTKPGSRVEKVRVGPLGSLLFDSAVSVSSGSESSSLVVEFVDFGGEMRRDIWHAFINEVIAVYDFIREYGPEDGDQSLNLVYGAHGGKMRAITSAINSITRLQALQFVRKLSEDPIKIVQFSYLRNAPYGDIVCQTLAVHFWGGPLAAKFTEAGQNPPAQEVIQSDGLYDVYDNRIHVFDLDGSVYLRKWMRSPSWASSTSIAFWKNAFLRQGIVLSKHLVVADKTLVERAAVTCKERNQVVEKTQATIDAAMLKGIPSNIDLFKELMLPLTITFKNFEKLRRWEEPHKTISFLAVSYTIIFRNMLSHVFPVMLMIIAIYMLLLKGLKQQGRLGRSFGKVTIRDQPPSNTIQKIMAIKEAMLDVENYLQNVNVTLLKVRTIVLSGHPQITTEVSLVLLSCATILLIVPFKFILAFLLLDMFTRELEFRKEMVMRFMRFLEERWNTIPAAPVVVLPCKSEETGAGNQFKGTGYQAKSDRTERSGKSKER